MHSRIKKLMVPTSSPLKRNISYVEYEIEADAEQKRHKNTETNHVVQTTDVIMQEKDSGM